MAESKSDFVVFFQEKYEKLPLSVQKIFEEKYPDFDSYNDKKAREAAREFLGSLMKGYQDGTIKPGRKEEGIEGRELMPRTVRKFGIEITNKIAPPSRPAKFMASAMPSSAAAAPSGDPKIKTVNVGSSADPKENIFTCPKPSATDVKWDDVAGQEDAKEQIKMEYIYPYTFPNLFREQSKGILFYGPPGTGKTMLVKAASSELPGSVLLAPKGGQLKGKYEGDTEKFIDGIFKCAEVWLEEKDVRTAIIFVDEFESIAGLKGSDPGMTRSVNAFLQGMDGVGSKPGVSVLAATNYPWKIEGAILRRFSGRVFVDLPNLPAKEYLVRLSLAKNFSCPNVNIKKEVLPNIMKSTKYIKNIATYGNKPKGNFEYYGAGALGVGAGYGTWKDGPDYVDEEFVKYIIAQPYPHGMGPTTEGEEIIRGIKDGSKYPTASDYQDKDPMFGYSASDIDKAMEIAIKSAATRALLDSKFKHVRFGGTLEENVEGCDLNDVDDDFVEKDDWYLASKTGKYHAIGAEGDQTVLGPSQKIKCISFDLRKSDIQKAIKDYKPTVSNCDYIEVLIYYKTTRKGGDCS